MEKTDSPVGECPHCRDEIIPDVEFLQRAHSSEYVFTTNIVVCPNCKTILGTNSTSELIENIDR